jgi:hypothetical protein
MRLIFPSDNLCTTGSPVTQNTCQPGTCHSWMQPLRLKMIRRRTRHSQETLQMRIYLACSRCMWRWMLHLHAQNACLRHRPFCLSNPRDNNIQQGTPCLHLTWIDEQYLPCLRVSHLVHTVTPVEALLYVPTSQSLQAVALPELSAYFPATQTVQLLDPGGEYLPASHDVLS